MGMGIEMGMSISMSLEWESTGESARLATTESASRESTATTVHHVEENVGIDVDMGTAHTTHASHASHSSHTAHTAHSAHATHATKHIGRVDEIVAVIVASTFSARSMSKMNQWLYGKGKTY